VSRIGLAGENGQAHRLGAVENRSMPSSMLITPETWKPPRPTWMPRSRSGLAISRARPRDSGFRLHADEHHDPKSAALIRAEDGPAERAVLVSSKARMSR